MKSALNHRCKSNLGFFEIPRIFNRRFRTFKSILVVLIFFALILNISQFVSATVEVEIELEEVAPHNKPKEAEVAPGKSGTVVYKGNVTVNRYPPSVGQVLISFNPLDTEGGVGWGGSVIPPSIAFQPWTSAFPQPPQPVIVTVSAPPMELMSAKRNATITGNWILSPGVDSGETIPYTFPIAVKHYYLFVIRPIDEYKKVWPGQPATFKLGIVNQGNAEDVFSIEVNPDDRGVLERHGFVVEIKQSTIRVAPRSTGIIEFTVHGPQRNFHIWKNQISMIPIRISTMEAPEHEKMTKIWMVAYYEVGTYIPDPCLILIIVGIVLLIIIVILRKRGVLKRRKHKRKKK